jgi:hypothetical protein
VHPWLNRLADDDGLFQACDRFFVLLALDQVGDDVFDRAVEAFGFESLTPLPGKV